jgi:DNA ligase D
VSAEPVTIEAGGREVRITSPDKVFFTSRGETKLDLARYYEAIEEPVLRTMGGRPTMMQRFPDGASGKSFFQKRVPNGAPDWLQTTEVATPNGTTSNALVIADLGHLLWAVNLGCIGFHPWPYRAADPDVADELRIDLDPSPGIGFAEVRQAALESKALLGEVGIASFVKTSGSKGIHIYVRCQPRWTSYGVRAAAVALARELERRHPTLITAKWWKEERGARVFVDFNQNAPHKTVFGAWCVRPRVGGQVSTPIRWEEMDSVEPDALTLATVPAKVAAEGDPWAAIDEHPQDLGALLSWYDRDLADGLMDAPWPPQYPKQPDEPPRVAPSRAKQDEG